MATDTRTKLATTRAKISQFEDEGYAVPVQLLEQESHLSLQLRNEQAAEAAAELEAAYADGKAHALTGCECDWSEEDFAGPQRWGTDRERAYGKEFLRGYRDGEALAEACPEAQVEALEAEIRDWLTLQDTHPGKAPKLEALRELLEMATARLSSTTLAA